MKLLLLSFYYPPDLSAGSFRAKGLIDALEKIRPANLEVDLVTSQPNRYADLAAPAENFEDHGWLRLHRVALPEHKGGMVDQAMAYRSYYSAIKSLARERKWDGVFATSSRLMTAASGAQVARGQDIPLYLDIRDLFVDTMSDILGSPLKMALMPALKWLEKRTLRSAAHINIVSQGFAHDIRALAPQAQLSVLTNGIDGEFLKAGFAPSPPLADKSAPLSIVYAGNIGEGQGLHRILPEAAMRLRGKAHFRIIGGGGRADQLRAEIEKRGLGTENIELLPPVARAELIEEYRQADILFLHLNDYAAFRKVIPSKIFEYAATHKPILAGVAGQAAEFLNGRLSDAAVFAPCDAAEMELAFDRLTASTLAIDRENFNREYARAAIMERMAGDILSLLERGNALADSR